MKGLIFIYEIFRKFPRLLIANTALLVVVSLFGACSLFAVSPVVDLLVHPDLQGVSPLTSRAINIMKFLGVPVTLTSWLIVFAVFFALSTVFHVIARYSIFKTEYRVLKDIVLGTFKDFFNSRWYFFTGHKQGTLLNTLTREATNVGNAFDTASLFFASLLQAVFFLAIPFYLSWQVTVISLGISLFFALPLILLGQYCYRLGALGTNAANNFISIIQENINLAKIVLGFGNQRKSIGNLNGAFDAYRNIDVKSRTLQVAIPMLYRPFGVIMMIVTLFMARHFKVPLSEVTVLLLALLQVGISISNMAGQKNALDGYLPSYEQIKILRQQARRIKQSSGARQFNGFVQELRIENISFAYPSQEPVLTDISMRIPRGKMVALVGESGAGKTTLIDIILGFYQPFNGRIMVDDTPLENFDIYSYRQKIGYVPQDSVLFNMTIRDNLLWGCASATDEEITHACRQANAVEFIERLLKGYNTLVGDRGVRLSGGQVQRVALARAILRKPDLLMLDEATSSLDTYSERLIQQAVENIARQTTVIVIAHRLSTIVNADYVYVLKGGRIVEKGTYPELVRINGHFNSMVKLQVLDAA